MDKGGAAGRGEVPFRWHGAILYAMALAGAFAAGSGSMLFRWRGAILVRHSNGRCLSVSAVQFLFAIAPAGAFPLARCNFRSPSQWQVPFR